MRRRFHFGQRVKLLNIAVYGLNSSTVFDDGVQNQLTGAAGDDWFFAGVKDKLTDRKLSEIVTATKIL
jgi:hypothetical protein